MARPLDIRVSRRTCQVPRRHCSLGGWKVVHLDGSEVNQVEIRMRNFLWSNGLNEVQKPSGPLPGNGAPLRSENCR